MKDLKNLGIDQYINILGKRRWYAIITAVLIASCVSAAVWRMPNLYTSEARVLVESPFVSEDYVRPIIHATPADHLSAIRDQIASRTFLERIVEQFQYGGFGSRPDFVMEDAVKSLRKQIGIEKSSESTFTISFTATDPQFARQVTKRLVDELIRSNTAIRMDKTIATDQFLDEQLRQVSQNLSAQEEKIKRFKTAHLGELPEQSNANLNGLSNLYAQLTATENALQQARQQKKEIEYREQQRKNISLLAQGVVTDNSPKNERSNVPTADEAELAAKKSAMAEMLLKYTSKHPDVQNLAREINILAQKNETKKSAEPAATMMPKEDLIKSESQNNADQELVAFKYEAEGIKEQIDKREKERLDILRQIKSCQARLNLAPALEQEMSALMREEEIQKQQYMNLQNKKFGSQMATTVETDKKNETYKIIDEPNLPIRPEYPNRFQYILIGIVGGLVMGIGAAFGRELLDSTIGSEDEAVAILNLPVLVSVLEIPGDQGRSIKKMLMNKERIA